MRTKITVPAVLAAGLVLAAPVGAAPRLEIGTLSRSFDLPGLRACFVARLPGTSEVGLRFLTTGAMVFLLDPGGHP